MTALPGFDFCDLDVQEPPKATLKQKLATTSTFFIFFYHETHTWGIKKKINMSLDGVYSIYKKITNVSGSHFSISSKRQHRDGDLMLRNWPEENKPFSQKNKEMRGFTSKHSNSGPSVQRPQRGLWPPPCQPPTRLQGFQLQKVTWSSIFIS